jgi:hypothetical protein
MKSGPILSSVLRLLNGEIEDAVWSRHISKGYSDTLLVHLLHDKRGDDLLSGSEKESLTKAWEVFDPMSWAQVKAFGHDPKIFPEWEDPGYSRKPITFESLI